ncbi:antibiotic biosynthesis monooxygenase [Hydrogenophilus thiooxidans]|uniref:antibiotic biosynthesis monooxygenase n=1 Tax=Hydrogenophilus thiooxidans TaxID=2820326 RepID=UPI001C226C84|nr:antibiotic biosynthesis monooxygenase [Hydrogenophilus thiooxidans]
MAGTDTHSAPKPAQIKMVLVSRRAKLGHEAELEQTWTKLSAVASRFPGYLGGQLIRPSDSDGSGEPRRYHMLFAFDTPEHLRQWQESPERALGLKALEPHVEGNAVIHELSGLEHWFPSIEVRSSAAPPRWKIALITWFGIYPTVLVLFLTIAPHLEHWPLPLRTAIITAMVVVAMTWFVAPTLTKWFHDWLHPNPPNPKESSPST